MSRIISLKVGSKDLDENKSYLVSTTGFVASGGDGYSIFTKGTVTHKEKGLAKVFFDGFKEKGEITLSPRDRQKDLAKH